MNYGSGKTRAVSTQQSALSQQKARKRGNGQRPKTTARTGDRISPRTNKMAPLVQLPCASANLRRASRLVSQLYDDALRPAGIRGPQFTLLQALKLAPGISQKQMAELLGMDSTTLTRTLALLERRGWLSAQPARDRRALRLTLTRAGEREYERVLPYWQSAQKHLKRALGSANWDAMIEAVMYTAEATR
jgi:DNA-binding MarR family transcriptional regulator